MQINSLTKSKDFDRETLMSCLKERIKKGVTTPLKRGEIKGESGNYYQKVKDRCSLHTNKGIFILNLSFKQDLSGQHLWEVKFSKLKLYNEDFLTIRLSSRDKQEITRLIEENIKIDRLLQASL